MLIHQFAHPLRTESQSYRVRVVGKEREDHTWTGWLEFDAEDAAGPRLVTDEETSQPNRTALEYWAGGLEPIYLEGALERARRLENSA